MWSSKWRWRVGAVLALLVAAFGGAAAVLMDLIVYPATGQVPRPLDYFRDRLEAFDSAFVWFGMPSSQQGSAHPDQVPLLVRLERASGRVVVDSSARVSWDGTHLWLDSRSNQPPERLGDEADAMMAELVPELLSGLSNSTFVEPGVEDWGPANVGTRVDLPFDWDDAYAILIAGGDEKDPVGVTVVEKTTLKPLAVFGYPMRRIPARFKWNVRLYDDMAEPENIQSRSYIVSDDGWNQEWDGPPFMPPWHEESTSNPLAFNAGTSQGFILPSGVEVPQTRLSGIACNAAGQMHTASIVLRYVVDDSHPSFGYLEDALEAGCPLNVMFGAVHDHGPKSGAKSRVQGTVQLRDVSIGPPAILAQKAFDETVTGPQGGRRSRDHRLETVGSSVGNDQSVELWIDGIVRIQCVSAGSTGNSVAFGVNRDRGPVLSWPDCYPELGVVP